MKTFLRIILVLSFVSAVYAADDVVTAVHGSIEKVDSGTKTIVVKTDDGIHHSFHVVDATAVHGADASEEAAKDSWHGLDKGGEVVVHSTKRGTEDTAVEIDKVGKGGLKTTEGTVKDIDRGGKKLVVDTGHGSDETIHLPQLPTQDARTHIPYVS